MIEYKNGVRVTKHYHEMDALEAAICRYEKLVKKHYDVKNSSINMPKKEREKKLAESQQFLNNQRMQLDTFTDTQVQLQQYREQGAKVKTGKSTQEKNDAFQAINAEKHHPTSVLEKYMRAEGVPKPSSEHTAHHILPGKGRHRQKEVALARVHMHLQGVRINDPANGVYLLTKDRYSPHWSMPNTKGHLKYHTSEYELLVSERVRRERAVDGIKQKLQIMGKILQDSEPHSAFDQLGKA